MDGLRRVYGYFKSKYELLALKKYTTIAGTLVFFLIMSIVPLSFWLTILIGKLPLNTEDVLSLAVFDSVKHVLSYVRREASNATGSASIVLIFTTLYASTNLFYQMRKSGEIIYDFHRERQGLRLRFGAFVLLVIVMLTVVAFLALFALGSFLFSRLFSRPWELLADYALLIAVAFFLVLLLNMYVCPYKTSPKSFLLGTFFTVVAWIVAFIGFSVYLRISNIDKLYGALSAIIVFLLWLYILMICFIVGVIFNSEHILMEHNAKKLRSRRKKSVA